MIILSLDFKFVNEHERYSQFFLNGDGRMYIPFIYRVAVLLEKVLKFKLQPGI